ncbi:MAG: hypothetical protein HKN04_13500 [Rhodothermaceae bacterium]|nr:hypothetical protein [Rhodothermaceae bacterium]
MRHIESTGDVTPFEARELAESLLVGPHYDPPYAGALQDEFAWHLVKYLREEIRLESEVAVERPGAFFAMDFLVRVPLSDGTERLITFECGGTRSLKDHQRQLRRDATLIGSDAADVVYRLRGSDLLHHMEDVLYLISQWEGEAASSPFSERGRINLTTLATPEAKSLRVRPEQSSVMLTYTLDPEADSAERQLWHAANGINPFILLRRLDRRFPDVWAPHAEPGIEQPSTPGRFVPLRKAS